jgi:dipeptidyl aminopeptidase/acylaminoacyl peptidase
MTVLLLPPVAIGLGLAALYLVFVWKYKKNVTRIFQEKPLFVIPRGTPTDDAEHVTFTTPDGLTLRGCYLPAAGPRRGVILFGLEFGSNRWSCRSYCEQLVAAGYDVFAYEPRNQGDSDRDPSYEPLQWVTDRDVTDMRAAVRYLKDRPDADPRGVGVFGVSKGGSTGLIVASTDPWVKCVATDGAYATYITMVPYIRRWVGIYSEQKRLHGVLPTWFWRVIGVSSVREVARNRGVTYPSVEKGAAKFGGPLLMIHGEGDTYIKPDMAKALFSRARGTKDLWLVPKAKHNQALHVAADEYHRRVVEFFDRNLGPQGAALEPEPAAGS